MLSSKVITLSGHEITVFGVSESDTYFQSVADGFEPDYTRVVEMNVRPTDICVDIGANIGLKTLQLAHLAPQGRVLAVEAAPRVYDCLVAGVAASGMHHITLEHAAVTAIEGTVLFEDNSAYGHISTKGVEVHATTLATLMDAHSLPRLDFLKIDVEGFEFPILRHSLPLFTRDDTIVYFELNSWCMIAFTDDHPRLCLEWLLDTFAEVYLLRRQNPPETQLERVPSGGAVYILAANMIHDGHFSDIVACMKPGRIRA